MAHGLHGWTAVGIRIAPSTYDYKLTGTADCYRVESRSLDGQYSKNIHTMTK